MALIHRVRRRLPHGRILLFEQIAEAYLEAIDAYRKIPSEFSLKEKKRWLAYIGYRMQARRGEQEKKRPNEPVREILVEREEVRAWLLEVMNASAGKPNPEVADRFLEHIGQRSGLLLPRGEGLFAFTHLSFQEYFAACHLEEQITSRRWAKGQIGPDEHPNPGDLALYAIQSTWRESLILLFELLAEKRPDWIPELLELLFGAQLELMPISAGNSDRALLLTEVVLDDYSGLNEEDRRRAGEVCWIATGAQIGDLEALLRLPNLRILHLFGFQASDLTPLQNLKQLQILDLRSTQVSDLTPLQNLNQLRYLYLNSTQVSDLTPLQNLKQLRILNLESTQVSDLTPLEGLQGLRIYR
jgi:internalin A